MGGGMGWVLKGEIKAPPLAAPLTGVSCLQLREGCEGKVIFFFAMWDFQLVLPED